MVVGYVLVRELHSRVNIQYFVYFVFLILLKTIVTVKHIHYLCIFNLDVDLLLACIFHLVFLFYIYDLLILVVLDFDRWINDILLVLDLVDLRVLRRLVHWLDLLL
jgi:hypothetical protein